MKTANRLATAIARVRPRHWTSSLLRLKHFFRESTAVNTDMNRHVTACAIASLLVFGCGGGESPSPPTELGGIAVLPIDGPGLAGIELARPIGAENSGHGTVFLASRLSDELLIEVDSATGRVVRAIGRLGEGPGEYRSVGLLLRKGDSLMMQSPLDGSITVYGPEGDFVRGFKSEVIVQAGDGILLRGDTLIMADPGYRMDLFSHPIHVVAPTGELLRSFGGGTDTTQLGGFVSRLRTLARASDSSFWSARRDAYEIERWNIAGVRERVLTMERDWFPPALGEAGDPSLVRPSPSIAGISVDSHGHLIVVLLRAASDWRPDPPKDPTALRGTDLLTSMSHFEVVVEVLDAVSGELLASHMPSDVLTSGVFLENGVLLGYAGNEDGVPVARFWRIEHRE